MIEQLLTLGEVCAMLNVKGAAVAKLAKDGRLAFIRISDSPKGRRRWRKADVEAFIRTTRQEDMTA